MSGKRIRSRNFRYADQDDGHGELVNLVTNSTRDRYAHDIDVMAIRLQKNASISILMQALV